MIFIEEQNDLFKYEGEAWLVHCISADFGMGRGIVIEFNNRYDLKNYMLDHFEQHNWNGHGYCIPVEEYSVFNLITKRYYFGKPSYKTLKESLNSMKEYIKANHIYKIAMPQISCGLDQLSWDIVKEMIQEIFDDVSVKIIVCKLQLQGDSLCQ